MYILRILILPCLALLISCSNNQTDKQIIEADSTVAKESIDSRKTELIAQPVAHEFTIIDSLKLRADSSNWHFYFNFKNLKQKPIDFFSGYKEYDEDKFGFQNPAYLKIFIAGDLVFEEKFEAYENHWMDFVGTYAFSDTLHFYKLNYGIEATDYVVAERLIAIGPSNIQTVSEFDFQVTDYASKFNKYIYPADSGGISNSIIVIDKINYRNSEESNLADTSYFDYVNGEFKKRVN